MLFLLCFFAGRSATIWISPQSIKLTRSQSVKSNKSDSFQQFNLVSLGLQTAQVYWMCWGQTRTWTPASVWYRLPAAEPTHNNKTTKPSTEGKLDRCRSLSLSLYFTVNIVFIRKPRIFPLCWLFAAQNAWPARNSAERVWRSLAHLPGETPLGASLSLQF